MAKSNKFSFIQDVAQSRKSESEQATEQDAPEAVNSDVVEVVSEPVAAKDTATPSASETPVRRAGRPRGKRSDPNYEQVTAYIRKDTHLAVKIALLQEGQGREFSELLQDLLGDFLSTQKSK